MGPVVLDASTVVDYLTEAEPKVDVEDLEHSALELHVPAICDSEVVGALSRLVRQQRLSADDARDSLIDYVSLPLTRHLHTRLIGRSFELRENFSATDTSYVALAEQLGADLATTDRSLARAVQRHTTVRCLP